MVDPIFIILWGITAVGIYLQYLLIRKFGRWIKKKIKGGLNKNEYNKRG